MYGFAPDRDCSLHGTRALHAEDGLVQHGTLLRIRNHGTVGSACRDYVRYNSRRDEDLLVFDEVVESRFCDGFHCGCENDPLARFLRIDESTLGACEIRLNTVVHVCVNTGARKVVCGVTWLQRILTVHITESHQRGEKRKGERD